MATTPLQVFIIYAREDEPFRAELKAQLRPMERAGLLQVWTDRELVAGEYWEPAIKNQLQKADIILLLVSSNYFQSDYIHEVEIKEALGRHARGEAHVIPIIVRPCDWESDPVIRLLQVLPTDGVPVNDIRYWHTREAAWVDVVRGIQRTLKQFQGERAENEIKLAQLEAEKTRAHKIVEQQTRMAEAEAKRDEAVNTYRRAEYSAWPNALQIGTVEAFQTYIATYPTGAYVREARQRIKRLQRSNNVMSYRRRTAAWLGVLLVLVIVVIFCLPKTNSDSAIFTESPDSTSNTGGRKETPNNTKQLAGKPIPQKEKPQKIPTDNDDEDNDGIPNKDDKCPDKKGTLALEGCPEKEPVFYPKGGGNGEDKSLDNNVTISEGMLGTMVVNRPKMINDTQHTGRVVIRVCINKEGEVTSATYTQRGSTSINSALRKRAELWARNYQFVASDIAVRCGPITFDFLVR